MELELQKRSFECYETVLDHCANHEETTDLIVPDSSPDILRILGAYGSAFLKDETVSQGKYTVSGTVSGWVLYVSEGDMNVRRLDVNIPFAHTFEHTNIDTEQIGVLEMCLSCLEAREVNPRKITVRANVALCAKTYRETVRLFPEGVSDAESHGVECKMQAVTLCAPIALKKKIVHINDDVELSATQKEFASMLRYEARFSGIDTKIIGSKAVVKGNVCLVVVYLSKNGEIESITRELPFSQILEIEGLNDECSIFVRVHAADLKLDPQYDMSGDVHYLALNLSLVLCASVWSKSVFDVIEDLYSIKYPLSLQNVEEKVFFESANLQKRATVIENIPCEFQAEEIVDVSVMMEPTRKRIDENGTLLSNGLQANVIYRAKDGTLCCVTKRMESVCPVGRESCEYLVNAKIDSVSCSANPSNEISVKLYVDYQINELMPMDLVMPERIITEQTSDDADGASVIVRKIRAGENLWELAKEYRTTVDEIMIANSLESDEIIQGDMILIPKK